MADEDLPLQYDFSELPHYSYRELMLELVDTHEQLANLHTRIGYLRAEEIRKVQWAKEERMEAEGKRDAYVEKKWLLTRLMDGIAALTVPHVAPGSPQPPEPDPRIGWPVSPGTGA